MNNVEKQEMTTTESLKAEIKGLCLQIIGLSYEAKPDRKDAPQAAGL